MNGIRTYERLQIPGHPVPDSRGHFEVDPQGLDWYEVVERVNGDNVAVLAQELAGLRH
jgi:hypothetical protein